MNKAPGFLAAVFGFGGGVFFLDCAVLKRILDVQTRELAVEPRVWPQAGEEAIKMAWMRR